jgi:hypothetical protein
MKRITGYNKELIDICASRHRGNPESKSANLTIGRVKAQQRAYVLQIIQENAPIGCQTISIDFLLGYTAVSARISELKKTGEVVVVGKTKTLSGCTAALYGVSNA